MQLFSTHFEYRDTSGISSTTVDLLMVASAHGDDVDDPGAWH